MDPLHPAPWLQAAQSLAGELKARHLAHHFHDESGNFGIVDFNVDRLFGTLYRRPGERPRSPTVFNLGYDETVGRALSPCARPVGRHRHRPPPAPACGRLTPMTGALTIVPVETAADRERFVDLPYKLYKDDPSFVPPLRGEALALISGIKGNPWFEHGELKLWLALRDGEVVGRISAQIDQLVLKHIDPHLGHFGLFDCIDDPAVADALLDHRREPGCKSRGMTKVQGPISISIWDEPGLLVEGFDTPPTVMMGHHLPYYRGFIEGRGYEGVKDLHTWGLDISKPFPEMVQRIVAASERNSKLVTRRVDKSRFAEEAALILDILNDAWSTNWGFVPLTPLRGRACRQEAEAHRL